jgi:hypothetical protein
MMTAIGAAGLMLGGLTFGVAAQQKPAAQGAAKPTLVSVFKSPT